MDRDLAVYVLVRNDLPSMNPGKAMAQVHHAGVQLVNKYLNGYDSPLVKEYIETGKTQGADNFNTTLVLSATLKQIENVLSIGRLLHAVCDTVLDPSYPFFVEPELVPFVEKDTTVSRVGPVGDNELFVRPEVTCGWILMDRNNPIMRSLVGAMPLHP
jgi:peptidyl-tRNA hydrolase